MNVNVNVNVLVLVIVIMTVAMQGGIDGLDSVKTRLSRQAAFLMCYKCFTFLEPYYCLFVSRL